MGGLASTTFELTLVVIQWDKEYLRRKGGRKGNSREIHIITDSTSWAKNAKKGGRSKVRIGKCISHE